MKRERRQLESIEALGPGFYGIEKPVRYLGGELGSVARDLPGDELLVALCFPDLYEIGMSNNAIRILYGELNRREGLRCDRVFAPAPDMEALLKELGRPLFTLESRTELRDVDILAVSLGYELAATTFLSVLETGGIALHAEARGEADPIVIMGGPAISNPHPFGLFIDAAYIGEAEASFFDLAEELGRMKRAGATRLDLLARMAEDRAVWLSPAARKAVAARTGPEGSRSKAIRAIHEGFSSSRYRTAFPLAVMKTVQDHGTVEVMRGCPNGCRFCHAGYYYRPQRIKPFKLIREEVKALVEEGGYRQITLASLSSGDYPHIEEVLEALGSEWGSRGISFQLPSLKINTFTLPLLEKLSEVRKAGLTFAVETPNDAWQRIINKDVSFDQTVAILEEAKSRGFRLAKFYFMIGLPVPGGVEAEADSIVDFFDRLLAKVPMQLNVNVGTFVPKPFTPFQWSRSVGEEEALNAIFRLKDGLKKHKGLKVSYHSPFISVLEGVISRGDERVGELLELAFRQGARLDAWDEYFDRDKWRGILLGASWNPILESGRERSPDEALPWDDVSIRISKKWLMAEFEAAKRGDFTARCAQKCTELCGACSDSLSIVDNAIHDEDLRKALAERKETEADKAPAEKESERKFWRLAFTYSKTGSAPFYPHLSVIDTFCRAFQMAGIPYAMSEGFNPMPRLELSQPLPMGARAFGEMGNLMLKSRPCGEGDKVALQAMIDSVNAFLPEGLVMANPRLFPVIEGKKIHTLASLSWGSEFRVELGADAGRKGLDLGQVFVGLRNRIDELVIPGAEVELAEGGKAIDVILPDTGRKEAGISRLLESVEGSRPIQATFRVTRLRCLAKGRHEVGYRDYMEALEDLIKAQSK